MISISFRRNCSHLSVACLAHYNSITSEKTFFISVTEHPLSIRMDIFEKFSSDNELSNFNMKSKKNTLKLRKSSWSITVLWLILNNQFELKAISSVDVGGKDSMLRFCLVNLESCWACHLQLSMRPNELNTNTSATCSVENGKLWSKLHSVIFRKIEAGFYFHHTLNLINCPLIITTLC